MSKGMVIDEKSGLCVNCCGVRLDGDDLVFSLGDDLSVFPKRGAEFDEEMLVRFLRLVTVRRGRRVKGEAQYGAAVVSLQIPRGSSPQYALADDATGALLSLAREIGPLFGSYGEATWHVRNSEYREPVSLWVQAAGALSFAARLGEAAEGRLDPDELNDEVAFYYYLSNGEGLLSGLLGSLDNEIMGVAVYAKDDPLLPAYDYMLKFNASSRPRVFPTTYGEDRGVETLLRADYGSIDQFHPIQDVAARLASANVSFLEKAMQVRFPDRAREAMLRELENEASSSMPGRSEVEPICNQTIYAYRIRSGRVDGGAERPDEELVRGTSAPAGGIAMLFGNDARMDGDIRREMYCDLYDALAGLHTWRCSDDLRNDACSAPFYSSVIEHLWCVMARKHIAGEVRFCRNCQEPFVPVDKKQRYCSVECQKSFRGLRESRLNKRIDAAVRWMEDRGPFTAGQLVQRVPGLEVDEDAILRRLKKLGRSGKFSPKVSCLGGNGRGMRWIVGKKP